MTTYHFLLSSLFFGVLKEVNCIPITLSNGTHDIRLAKALEYIKTQPETVLELMKSDYATHEGDIRNPRDGDAVNLWPEVNGQVSVPYVISSDLDNKTGDILAAMNMISKHTCISFHMQTSEVGYLLFQRSQGCASFVGYKGVAQHVYISSFCGIGNICHEILHALGFYHEHTREDRDEQIEVVYNNIRKGEEKNFALQNGSTFNLPYDISSILHYGRCFFSVNGQPTIIPKKGSKEMGQRSHMTELDVQRVRRLYKCDTMESKAAAEKKVPEPSTESITELQPGETASTSSNSSAIGEAVLS